MAPVVVVDTNVWVQLDQVSVIDPHQKRCVLACLEWASAFINSQAGIAFDSAYKILAEYWNNIQPGGLAEEYLKELLAYPGLRLHFVMVEYDGNGHAVLPEHITVDDASDRKFVAVVVQFDPTAPIINASETDWAKNRPGLAENGIHVEELCPDLVQNQLQRRN
ncbi:MAG: hypothetical protein K8I60_06305 [Anaerolineae bacterium]|nr:hypothetical protein [Anaerolineae bacterium]